MLQADDTDLRQVVITGRADSLLEISRTSSEGYVGRDHLDQRPVQRPGEVLETVPGLVATQHSGNGKANQYFLRGFNLDHGTDFATTLDGIPVNLPTHGHGQGYTDLNPLIPELVDTVHYRKGPYFADVGDFGSAGAADIRYVRELPGTLVSASGGSFGYARGLVAVDAFNLLDRADSDIDYFYESAITPGAAMEQRHFHPVEPISARVTVSARF
jgi:outer membrane cobalamin receptor